jgi:ankyrin repeat protein
VPGQWKQQLPTRHLALAARGDLPGLRRLLAAQPELLNKRGPHGRTLLWEAARRGRLEAVRWLLEQGADPDANGCYNRESLVQLTPYCAAHYYHRPAAAAYLEAHAAPLDIFRAAFMGERARVAADLAADPALLNAEDPHDAIYYVPLPAFAVAGGQALVLEDLLQRGAAVAAYSDQLLQLAARHSRMDLLERLIAGGADPGAVDAGIFVSAPEVAVLRYLLDQGASATRPGLAGLTPLQFVQRADKGHRPDKVALLRAYGAEQ